MMNSSSYCPVVYLDPRDPRDLMILGAMAHSLKDQGVAQLEVLREIRWASNLMLSLKEAMLLYRGEY